MESEHKGSDHNSVFYIPAGPDCKINHEYLQQMRNKFSLGQTPPDFPENNYEVNYEGRATLLENVTPLGRKLMAWPEVVEPKNVEL